MKIYRPKASAFFTLEIILLLIWILFSLAVHYYIGIIPIARNVVLLTLGVVFAFIMLIYLPLLFKRTCCYIEDDIIVSKFGAFFNTKTYMNKSSLIYISIVKTPLSRFTGINFLILNAFGTRAVVYFLTIKEQNEICQTLK